MPEKNLWGPIVVDNWDQIPHIKKKVAIEQDVQDGRAVFFIENDGQEHTPLDIRIPSIAYQIDTETNLKSLVIVIQAEKVDDNEIIGVRYVAGGNGVCSLTELEFIK